MPYFIRYQGRKQGPLSEAQLVTLLARGTVTKETETSVDETHWKSLGEFPEFERFYAQTIEQQLKQSGTPSGPPPLPSSMPPVPPPVNSYGVQPNAKRRKTIFSPLPVFHRKSPIKNWTRS